MEILMPFIIMIPIGYGLIILFLAFIYSCILSKILIKSDEKPWKAFIPTYNTYMLYKISNCTKYFWYTLLLVICNDIIIKIFGQEKIVDTIFSIAFIYYNVLFCSKLAKSFGKERNFTIGLFFFPHIFQLILAFDNSQYQKIED